MVSAEGGRAAAGFLSPDGKGLTASDLGGGHVPAIAVAAAPDGGLAAAGSSGGPGVDYPGPWMARLKPDGGLMWRRPLAEAPRGGTFNGAAAHGGGFVAVGEDVPMGPEGLGDGDLLAVAVGPGGEPEWSLVTGGSDGDEAHAVASLPDGRIAIAGRTRSSDGTFSWRAPGGDAGWDGFVIMLAPPGR
jgi:hypothetical protein